MNCYRDIGTESLSQDTEVVFVDYYLFEKQSPIRTNMFVEYIGDNGPVSSVRNFNFKISYFFENHFHRKNKFKVNKNKGTLFRS